MEYQEQALRKNTLICQSLYRIEGLVSREGDILIYLASSFSNQQEVQIHEFFPLGSQRRIDGGVNANEIFKQKLEKFIQKVSADEAIQLVFRENGTAYYIPTNDLETKANFIQNPVSWGSLIQEESVIQADEESLITSAEDVILEDNNSLITTNQEDAEDKEIDAVELPQPPEDLSNFEDEMKSIEISQEEEKEILAKFDKDIPTIEVPSMNDALNNFDNPPPKSTPKPKAPKKSKLTYKKEKPKTFQSIKKNKRYKSPKKKKRRNLVWYIILLLAIWYVTRALWENSVEYEYYEDAASTETEQMDDLMADEAAPSEESSGKYDQIGEFVEGMAIVKMGDYFGFINEAGEEVIAPQYEAVGDFSEGFAASVLNGQVGYIDVEGRDRVPHLYEAGWPFQEGVAMVQLNNMIGFVDSTGKVVVNMLYEKGLGAQEGRLAIQKDGKWAFCDLSGREITPFFFNEVSGFQEGYARVNINDRYGFINPKGEPIIPPIYDQVWSFNEGLAAVEKEGKIGFIDDSNKVAIPIRFDALEENFYNGRAKVKLGEETFFINKRGTRVE